MSWSTVFRYFGLAMEATEQAVQVMQKVSVATDPNSPGGSRITSDESDALVEQLDENFSVLVTRICQEAGLPIKSVTVSVEIER